MRLAIVNVLMKTVLRPLVIFLITVSISTVSINTVWAGIEVREFQNKEQEVLYNQLMFELRCLVCQNENLAASNADLAKDLRDEVYDMITIKGLGEKEVKEFLVARYGDFVLYKPPVKKSTWLLWFGPLIMLIIGFIILLLVTRNSRNKEADELDPAKREEMRKLLDSQD